ncbi:MAG: hypothetical protein V3S69_02000 [Dehalococcoidales bacterium]
MADSPIFIGSYVTTITAFIAAHGTVLALPIHLAGSSGGRVHGIAVAATDAGANTALLYYAERMTLESAMGTGAFVDNGGSADTLTRTSGSFVTDGWLVGDRMLVADPTTLANSFFVTLTIVAALTLTFVTASVDTVENLPTGSIIYRLSQLHLTTLAANAGNAASTDALDMLITDFPIADVTPDRYLTIGANDGLAMSVGTAVGASPDRIDVTVFAGDY